MVQANLAKDGYTTIEDLADRWNDPAAARAEAPRELEFQAGGNEFDDKLSRFTAMRLHQAVREAKEMLTQPATLRGGNGCHDIPLQSPHHTKGRPGHPL